MLLFLICGVFAFFLICLIVLFIVMTVIYSAKAKRVNASVKSQERKKKKGKKGGKSGRSKSTASSRKESLSEKSRKNDDASKLASDAPRSSMIKEGTVPQDDPVHHPSSVKRSAETLGQNPDLYANFKSVNPYDPKNR
ncbi:unnamed protein product [Heligmosomoides polygyrus]|uniref:Uncharacterized protein n=1 Tax=Heligmosomoides polygyrus TaxID=6339 RepID=A0A183G8V1_HELPZ|nr:unnamed protein product [Heligmosomoides polygyrus]